MKHPSSESPARPASAAPAATPLKRRGMLLGGAAAAVAGVAAAVTARSLAQPSAEPVATAKADDVADGYRLSPHVLRYYETTRI